MSEKKSLSQLLRDESVYRSDETPASDGKWRDALLEDFEQPATIVRRAQPIETERAPLSAHHLLVLAPVGVGLFLGGWAVGTGLIDLSRLADVPLPAWAALTAAGSIGWLLWRRSGARRTR